MWCIRTYEWVDDHPFLWEIKNSVLTVAVEVSVPQNYTILVGYPGLMEV